VFQRCIHGVISRIIPDMNIHNYTTLCDLSSHETPLNRPNCPSANLFKLFVLVFKPNIWRGSRGRDSLKKRKILHQSSWLLQIIGLFCKIASLLYVYSAKETYDLKEPTSRSHPICIDRQHICCRRCSEEAHLLRKMRCFALRNLYTYIYIYTYIPIYLYTYIPIYLYTYIGI